MDRLISWLLNVVYCVVLLAGAPLILWQSIRTGKYRQGYREKLFGWVPRREGQGQCVWIHAVSVGEVNLIDTCLRAMHAAKPEWQFVVSTTSRAGYELARKKYGDLTVFYCPLDFSWAARNAMRRVRPNLVVLAELELWPNLIAAAKEHGARVAIVNGRLSDHSFPRYHRMRAVVGRVLRQIDLIAAQDEESARRFRLLGAPAGHIHVTGSLKYDGAQTERDNPRTVALRKQAGFVDDDIVFLAGSTQAPEEQIAVEIFRRLSATHPRLRLVLVPRHPERFDAVAKLLDESAIAWRRRTELASRPPASPGGGTYVLPLPSGEGRGEGKSAAHNEPSPFPLPKGEGFKAGQPPAEPGAEARILLVDTIGELSAWWGTAQIAFVGGSFGSRGGQNMIEPAAYGAAVSFGPNTWNFRDIVAALLAADAAVVVKDGEGLESFVRRCLDDRAFAEALGARARALVRSQIGATGRTIALINTLLDEDARDQRAAA